MRPRRTSSSCLCILAYHVVRRYRYRSYDSFVNSWICNWSLLRAGKLDTRLTRINRSDLAISVLIDGHVMLYIT